MNLRPELKLSPSVQLAVACCAWPPSPAADDCIRRAAELVTDWDAFDAVVRHHRVTPLVHRALIRARVVFPDGIRARQAERAVKLCRHALLMARECLLLEQAFDRANIPSLFLKGVSLAMLAYGDVGAKEACDIDLLVRRRDAGKAREILLGLGYESCPRGLTATQFDRWIETVKEAPFVCPDRRLVVDLHWELTNYPRLLPQIGAQGPTQVVPLTRGAIRTLPDEPLFSYLCLHGAFHAWVRLKWLADLNGYAAKFRVSDLDRLIDRSHALGAHRSASVALRLCEQLFGLSLNARTLDMLEDNRATRAMIQNVLLAIDYRGGATDAGAYTAERVRRTVVQFLMAPGVAHLLEQARHIWNSPHDRLTVPLPKRWHFAYHFMRIPLWVQRSALSIVGSLLRSVAALMRR